MKKWILRSIILICAAVFLYAAAQLIQIGSDYAHNRETQEDLQEIFFQQSSSEESSQPETSQQSQKEQLPEYDFAELLRINPDVRGWLMIPAAGVNGVVAQGSDNQTYLHTNLYGEYEYAGTLFMDYRCEDGPNTVIYGHNMLDGSMFGTLDIYLNEETGREFPSFWYITPDQVYRCDIFSTYLTTVAEEYLQIYFADDQDFMEYIQEAIEASVYDFGVTVEPGDTILSLSTCNYQEVETIGRQVLYARMTPMK